MYKVGIVGYGYVGKGMNKLFGDFVTAIYDPAFNKDKSNFKDVDLAVICVPTPMNKNGSCDTSLVRASVKWLRKMNKGLLILIKSTVEVGTTEELNKKYKGGIVFSPEYMGEGNYFTPPWLYLDPKDPTSHGFVVLGGDQKDTEKIAHIMIKKMGPHTKFTFLASREAEAVKYWENIWGAMKVIFTNQMFDHLKDLGVDFYKAREGWAADPRVERMHTAVFEKARGFSGKCYPKDLRAFIHSVEVAGGNPKLLKAIWNINVDYRPEEFDKIK